MFSRFVFVLFSFIGRISEGIGAGFIQTAGINLFIAYR